MGHFSSLLRLLLLAGLPLGAALAQTTTPGVGIGLTTPTQALDVNGGLLIRSYRAITTQGAHLQWNKSNGDGATWLLNQRGGGPGGLIFGAVTTSDAVTEWGRFDGSGRLGLGTTAPSRRLHVVATGTALDGLLVEGGSQPMSFSLKNARNTADLGLANSAGEFDGGAAAGDLVLRAGTNQNLILTTPGTGSVRLPDLAGTGVRVITADASGNLAGTSALSVSATGSVGVGTTAPDASAALDISSTSKGILPPRLSQAQRNAVANPAAGLTIFNTTSNVLNTWDGTQWTAPVTNFTAVTFTFTGGVQTYTVPAGVNQLSADVVGAGGGPADLGRGGQVNSSGGRVQAILTVTPGQVLTIYVGGAGGVHTAGYNGGGSPVGTTSGGSGGGGASDVRVGGTALTNRVLVAGGGGGGGSYAGGSGGLTGGNGQTYPNQGYTSGLGGTQTAGGAGGASSNPGTAGNAGSSGQGGSSGTEGGGGGGGYYGGGGGGGYAGGGGGSSYAGASTGNVLHTQGYQNGNGYVALTPVAAPTLDASNFVNLPAPPGDNLGNHTATQNLNLAGNLLVGGGSQGLAVSSSGNVGVGTTSPNAPLTVQASSSGATLGFFSGSGTDKYNFSLTSGGLSLSESNVAAGRLFVKDGGNVGIGTTTPASGLHVTTGNSGPGTGAATAGALLSGAPGLPPYLELRGSGTATTPYLDFAETSGVDYSTRLLSSGGVLTVSSTNTSGNIFVVNGPAGATAFNTTSDQRLKTDVRPLGGGLASVLALRGVRYRWNAQGVRRGGQAGAEQVGLLAQELEKVYPELVSTGPDGYKTVNYAQLAPVLIEALKEQQAQIENLQAQNAAATQRAARTEASLGSFEQRLRALEAGQAPPVQAHN